MLEPLTHCAGLGIKPTPLQKPKLLELNSFFFSFFLFRAAPTTYEVPRLGVELELELLTYTTAIATLAP